MPVTLNPVRSLLPPVLLIAPALMPAWVLLLACAGMAAESLRAQPAAQALTPAVAQALVQRALATEARAAQDLSHVGHPMRYQLHKTSPRLSTTKEIVETKDGDVARLLSINGQPLNAADEQTEQARLQALIDNPGLQQHRKQSEDSDTARAMKVLRVLPNGVPL